MKNLYFDNLVYRVETVEDLGRTVGADHVMVGTDYPFDLGDWKAAEKIRDMECTTAEREAMLRGNATEAAENRVMACGFYSRQANFNVADN